MSGDVFIVTYVALWVLVVILGFALFALYQHFGQMYIGSPEGRASHGPSEGTHLPSQRATSLDGSSIELPPPGRPALLLFATTSCRLCTELRGSISVVARRHPDVVVQVVCGGHPRTVESWSEPLKPDVAVVVDKRRGIAASYGIGLTPFLVAVDTEGVVRIKGIATDQSSLEFAAAELGSAQSHAPTAHRLEVSHG